ncbi:hypothetical protein BRD56_11985 [Thermoplasmatales archaeon SW_10_69_26]|jgi:uncharacterized protein (TIGR00369 family)|nr:MAG: hypothetical protein BRD56_11985 [Thermoplasmatales archaeon SW_10_69_26]
MAPAQRTRTHPTDGFTNYAGIEETHLLADGRVEAEIEVREEHLNEGGVVHGGLLATALDVVMGSAVVATLDLDEGQWCATQSLTTDFLRPVREGEIRAVGEIDRRGSLAANVSGEIHDEEGRVVARATGVWAIRRSG